MVAGQHQTLDNMLVLHTDEVPGLHLQSESLYIYTHTHSSFTMSSFWQHWSIAGLSAFLGLPALCWHQCICQDMKAYPYLFTQHAAAQRVFPPLQKHNMPFLCCGSTVHLLCLFAEPGHARAQSQDQSNVPCQPEHRHHSGCSRSACWGHCSAHS
jgi:hypothetical protein